MPDKYDSLKLDNQLCFPLYACSKEIVRMYKPFLDDIDLTYTQYITMMVMWETEKINVKSLGERLYLDSGTLTPLLKKLESKGYIERRRSKTDERNLIVSLTDEGRQLKKKAVCIPEKMAGCVHLSKDEAFELYRLLHKVLSGCSETEGRKDV
jgi:DNA-binding MarR family transcriptional regulator